MNNYASGINAEAIAVRYLQELGYDILRQRYKTKYGEIDIIACKADLTAFVEVKFRKNMSDSFEAITPNQQERIHNAAEVFIIEHPNVNYRFDAILLDKSGNIEYLQNAF